MKTVKELREKEATASREAQVVYSTSEGRAKFPDLLQSSFGDKRIIGFDRYGRIMGAVVPIEAVRILAGLEGLVDEDTRSRIQKTARHLLAQLPNEAALLARADDAKAGRSESAPKRRSSQDPLIKRSRAPAETASPAPRKRSKKH